MAIAITIVETVEDQTHIRIEHTSGVARQFLTQYADKEALKDVIRTQRDSMQAEITADEAVKAAVQAAIDEVKAE
jgi:hypothetical protein